MGRQSAGLAVSALLHGALVGAIILEIELFGAQDEPEVEFVEAQILSAEEFNELTAAPEPAPPEAIASVPPAPEPEPPQPPSAPAPYQTAPEAPNPLVFDPDAAQDAPVEDKIREALPKPRVAQPTDTQRPPPSPDAAPQVDLASDEPPPVEQEPPSPRPRIVEAPTKPVAAVRDQAPKPDQPDTPPENEPPKQAEAPKPEPAEQPKPAETAAAPETAPTPKARPRRVAAAPEPKPDEPKREPPKPVQNPPERTAERSQAPVVGQPLSLSERNGLRISLRRCWSRPDLAGVDPSLLVVKLTMQLRQDGRLSGRPRVILPKRITVFRQRAAILAAQQALARCQPYRLPPAKYASWRTVNVTFDPRDDAPGVQ